MRVYCFGDSNTYGFDPQDRLAGRYGPGDRWPELLAALTGAEVVNAGANGRQIPRGGYLSRLLERQGAVDLVLVMLGTNDLLQGASPDQVADRMAAFLKPLLAQGRAVVLIAPPPLRRGAWVETDALAEDSLALGRRYRDLAEKLGAPFVDTGDWAIPLAFDGVHFTPEGNRLFARNLARALRELNLL